MSVAEGALPSSLAAVADWLWRDDPLREPAVEARARALLLDCLGCALAALAKPELAPLAAALAADEPGPVRLPGVPAPLGVSAAAALLAMTICWDEACEGLPPAHGRPGIHAVAPALALGLARGASLGALLRALVVGYEIGGRLGMLYRIRPGMHVDGTWGTFGAVAAVAHLRGLDAPAMLAALNMAACQLPYSLYLPITGGHTARNSYLGHAAQLALLVTAAAAGGMTAPRDAVAVQRRLALGRDDDPAVAPPGRWLLGEGYLKPFAAVRHVHYGVACALAWRAATGGDTRAIRGLRLRVYQEALTYCPNRAPATAIQAQFSLSYGLAWALRHGGLEPDAYLPESLADAEQRRLEALVALEVDGDLTAAERRGASLIVSTAAGDWQGGSAGSPADPERAMTPGEIEGKFRAYAGRALGAAGAERLAAAILRQPVTERLPV